MEISEGTVVKTGDFYYYKLSSLGLKLCDSNDLSGYSEEYIKRGIDSSMYCPENKRYRVSGNYKIFNIKFETYWIHKH